MQANVIAFPPVIMTPSPRIMRKENQTQDRYHLGNGRLYTRELNPGEASLAWMPRLLPLFSFPWEENETRHVQAGSAMAIVRSGYEGSPLGIVTSTYRPVNHAETAADIAESTQGRCTPEGALIDGHGYHVAHAFRLNTLVSEMVGALPLVSRLTLVHDHTGKGALRASIVCYLGSDVVLGSRNFTRRIHVGTGSRDVGIGSRGRWSDVIDAMLETASLQQGTLAATLRKAAETPMTEQHAAVFERAGVEVERTKVTSEEQERGIKPSIVPATALDVVIAHHKQHKGRLSWGVWSKRLEGGALGCLETITGIELPRQLFRRG
jgi:hypothetical protein